MNPLARSLLVLLVFSWLALAQADLGLESGLAACKVAAYASANKAINDCAASSGAEPLEADFIISEMQGNLTVLQQAAASGDVSAFDSAFLNISFSAGAFNEAVENSNQGFPRGTMPQLDSAIACKEARMQQVNAQLDSCISSKLRAEKQGMEGYYSTELSYIKSISSNVLSFGASTSSLDSRIYELESLSSRISTDLDEGDPEDLYNARLEFARTSVHAYLAAFRSSASFIRSHPSLYDNDNAVSTYEMADMVIEYANEIEEYCPNERVGADTNKTEYSEQTSFCWSALDDLSRISRNTQFVYASGRPEESVALYANGLVVARGSGKAVFYTKGRADVVFLEDGAVAPTGWIKVNTSSAQPNLYGSGTPLSDAGAYSNVSMLSVTDLDSILLEVEADDFAMVFSGFGRIDITGEGEYELLRGDPEEIRLPYPDFSEGYTFVTSTPAPVPEEEEVPEE